MVHEAMSKNVQSASGEGNRVEMTGLAAEVVGIASVFERATCHLVEKVRALDARTSFPGLVTETCWDAAAVWRLWNQPDRLERQNVSAENLREVNMGDVLEDHDYHAADLWSLVEDFRLVVIVFGRSPIQEGF